MEDLRAVVEVLIAMGLYEKSRGEAERMAEVGTDA